MNEEHDPFEAELRDLRPHAISPSLHRRIAQELAADRTALWTHGRRGPLALVGGLVAASLLAAVLWFQGRKEPLPKMSVITPVPPPALEAPDPMPTFRAYQHALAQSPEAVDTLFDKYAALPLTTQRSATWARAFPFSNADLP